LVAVKSGEIRDALCTQSQLSLCRPSRNRALHERNAEDLAEAAIAIEDRNQILCEQTKDVAEGVAAFLESGAGLFGPLLVEPGLPDKRREGALCDVAHSARKDAGVESTATESPDAYRNR
jgi:hypothetical protein